MCALLEDRTGERWIYESVRRIYDVQSSSEDSLGDRIRRGADRNDRRAPSITNSRAARTASLFIDRLKSDFRRDDDFVGRFRTHCQRNWRPKFTTKYLCEPEEGERPTPLRSRGDVSKCLVSVTPRVYSIGLLEPSRKTRRKSYLDNRDDVRERAVEYFKRCTLLARRSLSRNDVCSKKWIPNLFSSSSMSIPVISIPTELRLPVPNEKYSVVRSNAPTTNESMYRPPARQALLLDYGKFDRNERERKKNVSDKTYVSKRFISNVGTSTGHSPREGLAKDLYLDDISSNGSSVSDCRGEFFTPIESTRELRSTTASEEYYSENGILEDIRKRIDQDFDRSSSKLEEDFQDFSYSDDSTSIDEACSLGRDHDREILLDPEDDPLPASIEQSKSVPTIPSTVVGTRRRSFKSVTSLSPTTSVQDDFFDPSTSRTSISKYTLGESYDSNYDPTIPSRSSIGSCIIRHDYAISHDFPFARRDVSPERDKALSARSSLDYPDLGSVAGVPSVFSVSNGSTRKKLCAFASSSKRKSKETFSRGETPRREKLSEYRLVESIDSGVLTDYSRHDLRTCGRTAEWNANAFRINERRKLRGGDASYTATDSVCSDDSLDRRVDRAVRKCTEDLALLERRIKLKSRTFGGRLETSKDYLFALFDWSSGDECIGSISTPSLVSLTDSEAA